MIQSYCSCKQVIISRRSSKEK